MSNETNHWRAEMPTGITINATDGPYIIRGRFVSEHSAEALVTRANAELDALRAQLAAKDARIRELTEWRPMNEAPLGVKIFALISTGETFTGVLDPINFDTEEGSLIPADMLRAWFALPPREESNND